MADTNDSIALRFNTQWATPILAIITCVIGYYVSLNRSNLDTQTATITNLKTQMDTKLNQIQFENNLKLELLTQVKDAIKQKDSSIQKLTLLYIDQLIVDTSDYKYRDGLENILVSESGYKTVANTKNTLDTFNDPSLNMQITTTKKYTVDIFYLDDIPTEGKPNAIKIKDACDKAYGNNYNIRVRHLPSYINVKSGYRIERNVIRYKKEEVNQATNILDCIVANHLLPLEKPILQEINSNTPGNYISVFVRNL